ncbi:MAG: hypothetical protein IH594_05530, partial [Bacteroidales bacterium]|nr:hypothetical protein [Bacteroidales bacterium]
MLLKGIIKGLVSASAKLQAGISVFTLALVLSLLHTLPSYAQTSFKVKISSLPDKNRFCAGSPEVFRLEAVASGGTSPYTYEWTFSWSEDTLTDKIILIEPAESGEVRLKVTDSGRPAKSIVEIYSIYESSVDSDFEFIPDSVCAQTPIRFVSEVSGGTPGYFYQWHFGDGLTSGEKDPEHEFIASGCTGMSSFNVLFQVWDTDGCYTFAEKIVHVKNKPYLDFNDTENPFSPFKHCHPVGTDPTFDVVLENNSLNTSCISGYTLDWGDGTVINGATFPARHTYTTAGAFELVITANNTTDCELKWSKFIYNQSSPAAGMESYGGTEGCAPIEFAFGLVGYENNSIGTSYTWNFGDGSPPIVWDHNDPFINDTIKHTYNNTSCIYGNEGGDFTTVVMVNNGCGEIEAKVTGVRVWLKPQANIDHGNYRVDSICTNEAIALTNNSRSGYYGTFCTSHTLYNWDFGDGFSSDQPLMPSRSWEDPGEYDIVLEAANPCGISKDTFKIVVMDPPVAAVTVDDTTGCAPMVPVLKNNSTGEALKYAWEISPSRGWEFLNGTGSSSFEPEIRFNKGGTYQVALYIYNVCEQTDSVFLNIDVFEKAEGTIEDLRDICITDPNIHPSVSFKDNGSPVTFFRWSFPGGSPYFSYSRDPGTHSYAAAGNYEVGLIMRNGCGNTQIKKSFHIWEAPEISLNTPVSICESGNLSISGTTVSNETSFVWQTTGDGFFREDTFLNPIYLPGIRDLLNSGTELMLIAEGEPPCPADTAMLSLSIQGEPRVQVDEDAFICEGNAYQITNSFAENYDYLEWSTNGDGYFSDPAILQPTYYPGSADLSSGNAEISLTAYAIVPCNQNVTKSFSIYYAKAPVINAGPDADICKDGRTQLSASG